MRLFSTLGRSLVLGATIAVATAGGASAAIPPPHLDGAEHRVDLDARTGTVEPTDAQRAAAAALGADARWNRFGTPHSLFRVSGALASGLPSDPVAAAREFLHANRPLFRLEAAEVDDLEVVGNTPVGAGHAVLLRQRFGSLRAGTDGLVALAVVDGQVLDVTSTARVATARDDRRAVARRAARPGGARGAPTSTEAAPSLSATSASSSTSGRATSARPGSLGARGVRVARGGADPGGAGARVLAGGPAGGDARARGGGRGLRQTELPAAAGVPGSLRDALHGQP